MCHSIRIWRTLVKILLEGGRKVGCLWRNPLKCYLISARPRLIKKTNSCQRIGVSLVWGRNKALFFDGIWKCPCQWIELFRFVWGQSWVFPGDLTIIASQVAARSTFGDLIARAGPSACRHGGRLRPGLCCIADWRLSFGKTTRVRRPQALRALQLRWSIWSSAMLPSCGLIS